MCRCSSRPIDPSPVDGIAHINLDLALEFLPRPAAMTDRTDRDVPLAARVIEVDAVGGVAPLRSPAPRVIPTERTERVTPVERAVAPAAAAAPARRRDRVVAFGLAGVAVFFAGWLAVDAIGWISAAFERSTALGAVAATALTAGVAGAGAVIARELGSLFGSRTWRRSTGVSAAAGGLAPAEARGRSPTCWRLFRESARSKPRSRPSSARSSSTARARSRSRSCRAPS
jgi:hypothetical protein